MHKLATALLLYSSTMVFVAPAQGQSVDDFGVYYRETYSQQDGTGSQKPAFSDSFYVEAIGSSLSSFGSTTYQTPDSASQFLFTTPSGAASTRLFQYVDAASRDAQHALGTYTINLGAQNASLDLSIGAFTAIPELTSGLWQDDRLQVSEAGYTFTFNTPAGADLVRMYLYQQATPFNTAWYSGDGSTTSFFVPDSFLMLGMQYGAAIDFINSVDTTTAFSGATGQAGYLRRLEFQFTVVEASAVPEPAAAGALLALCALLVARRR